jgi:hypothetical protein
MVQNGLVFSNFYHWACIYEQNAYDIRNQRRKLNQMTCVLLENNFRQTFLRGGDYGRNY